MTTLLINFCRSVIGIVFLFSSLGKLRNISAFESAIQRFKILPLKFTRISAWLVIYTEIAVVVLTLLGHQALQVAFGLAIILLVIFSVALLSAIKRNIAVPCNCFGISHRPASIYDIGRNLIFIACAIGGEFFYGVSKLAETAIDPIHILLVGFSALAFVMVIINISEFFEFFDIFSSKENNPNGPGPELHDDNTLDSRFV